MSIVVSIDKTGLCLARDGGSGIVKVSSQILDYLIVS